LLKLKPIEWSTKFGTQIGKVGIYELFSIVRENCTDYEDISDNDDSCKHSIRTTLPDLITISCPSKAAAFKIAEETYQNFIRNFIAKEGPIE
jgi:hypothetical protein